MDDFDGDLYNKHKYAQQASTSTSRPSSHAARRYSPMNTSPTTPYLPSSYTPQQQQHRPSLQSSPTRPPSFNAPSSQGYYTSPTSRSQHPNQLPPIQSSPMASDSYYPQSATAQLNAAFGREMSRASQTPQQQQQQQQQQHRQDQSAEASVPQFTKCTNVNNIQPHINAQPAFRRANPEGGFISPLHALTTHLPATYRICNPNFQYESSRNPRRVLTKPSKGTKNDGYDNEDSDYILYVNDILGSEETNHKNRYLILDVLGQGTFGQVVKCQNLKTQEVVAVKVVKNKTAYFNQSMMEVSVLDLVSTTTRTIVTH